MTRLRFVKDVQYAQNVFKFSPLDLIYDAETLEQSARINDKYTVRRVLDTYHAHYQLRKNLELISQLPDDVGVTCAHPSVFLNILHLAIENGAMDVLRICLKYGLNPNGAG
jgi:hypothetical protein